MVVPLITKFPPTLNCPVVCIESKKEIGVEFASNFVVTVSVGTEADVFAINTPVRVVPETLNVAELNPVLA